MLISHIDADGSIFIVSDCCCLLSASAMKRLPLCFLKMFHLILLVINVLFPYRIPASYILIGYADGNVFCVIVRFGSGTYGKIFEGIAEL